MNVFHEIRAGRLPVPETPCLVIDEPLARENIARVQQGVNAAGCQLRPHIKTHKNHHADRSALGTNRDEREQTNGRLSCRIKFEEEAHYNAR